MLQIKCIYPKSVSTPKEDTTFFRYFRYYLLLLEDSNYHIILLCHMTVTSQNIVKLCNSWEEGKIVE